MVAIGNEGKWGVPHYLKFVIEFSIPTYMLSRFPRGNEFCIGVATSSKRK